MPRKSRKNSIKDIGGGDNVDQPQSTKTGTRIFLYLQPKAISYPIVDDDVAVEIELEHPNPITKLCDHYTPENVIHLDEFIGDKPTFCITIIQDDIEACETPLSLILYENVVQSFTKENDPNNDNKDEKEDFEEAVEEEDELVIIERKPVAQGYIDLLEFFTKTRYRSNYTVFLYPLPNSIHRLTCKMEWEIYSLHPLVKHMKFSNILYLSFNSIYNLDDDIMDTSDDLVARLSLLSYTPNEMMLYDKIPICQFRAFSKQLMGDQILDVKWEKLKNRKIGNEHSMSIMASEAKVNIQYVFQDLLMSEDVDFNTADIDSNMDMALVCNSFHRYILTESMEKALEDIMAFNKYRIIVELFREKDPTVILLQGYINLSIFMYPQVSNCSFAIEMRPPGYQKPVLPTPKDFLMPKSSNKKGKRKGSASTIEGNRISTPFKEKVPFAIIHIGLDKSITDPIQDIIDKPTTKAHSLVRYSPMYQQEQQRRYSSQPLSEYIIDELYCGFDKAIVGMIDYILRNNIKSAEDNKQFFCSQKGNLTNRILRLVAVDFNRRRNTKTNLEFMNLMTLVYEELLQRSYNILIQCSSKGIGNCIMSEEQDQNAIITQINTAKFLYEVGNLEMVTYIIQKLQEEYRDNIILKFYIFLYDMERQDFVAAKRYLDKPYKEKYTQGLLLINTISLYIIYKLEQNDPNQSKYAKENLIQALEQFCELNHQNISTWILLYCVYKQHNYLAGMEYCRWKYENLYKNCLWELPIIPQSLWEIYMPYEINCKSIKSSHFYKVVNLFLKLGLYEFAEWIFNEIIGEVIEVEKYFMINTFKIFSNKLELKFQMKTFPVEKFLNSMILQATLSQVNGNLEYFRSGPSEIALKNYSQICFIENLENYGPFSLSIIRYAYQMMAQKDYAKAREAFSLCPKSAGCCLIVAIGKGKACYKLNDLDESEKAFADATRCGLYLPNVWAYLALINLKKGENYKALECWKYARLNHNEDIHDEILQELNCINHDDINLYIDLPDLKMGNKIV
ncbi:uncharacterized protein LOC142226796 [Haematobia irritans]|uniref:uncharacterized protein LOC142226796 n=1 Tax=Haematobia irritans TaxID=7368 RepID=UPI003F506976